MGETSDKITGNIKETAGDLTGDRDLENDGKTEKAGAEIKEKLGDAVDKVKDVLHKD